MKLFNLIFIAGLFIFGCKNQSPNEAPETEAAPSENTENTGASALSSWEGFWQNFNTAVQNNDARKVVEMTVMPLRGHHHGALDAGHFTSHFRDIFDEKTKGVFANADDRVFNTIKVNDPTQAASMNVAPGTEVKVISVNYIFNEGTDSQTESMRVFNFGKIEGEYKLLSLLQAG